MADNDHTNKLIARLTDRLAGDPELQADVARELQTHLEDAAEEFREAGLDEQEAEQQAAKALGDPEDISEQLFQANRSRMRFRAIARWAASLALLPAAIVVVVFLAISLQKTHPIFYLQTIPKTWTQQLTEEQLFILRGDPQANSYLEVAKSISDRWPDNPIYFGDYFAANQGKFFFKEKLPQKFRDEQMALANRGEEIDPDNAFYNFTRAAWLIDASCTLEDDPSRQYEVTNWDKQTSPRNLYKITITNPEQFQQGLEEFRRGLQKPFYSSRTVDMLDLRMALLPTSQSMSDILCRTSIQVSTLLPSLSSFRTLGKAIGAYALAQAQKQDSSAVDLARDTGKMGDMIGAGSGTAIELLVAVAIRQIALANLEQVGRETNNDALIREAQRLQRQQKEVILTIAKLPQYSRQDLRHMGMYWSVMTPAVFGYRVNWEPLRTAECFVVLEIALWIQLLGFVVLSCIFGLPILIWMISCRRSPNRPILLFVGWWRIGKIVLVSILIPLVVYTLYVSWQIFRPNAYGLNYTLGRWIVELTLLFCVMLVLLLSMNYRAIRRRCLEIGLPSPSAITLRRRIVVISTAIFLLLACAVYIVGWWAGPFQKDNAWLSEFLGPFDFQENRSNFPFTYIEIVLWLLLLASPVIWLVREGISLFSSRLVQFHRTFIRSTMPILCSAVIVVGLTVGSVLFLGERCAARRAVGPAEMGLRGEIDRSGFRLHQEDFIQRRQQDGKQEAGSRE